MKCIIVLLVLVFLVNLMKAEYEVQLDRIEPYVEPDQFLDLKTLRIKKHNRTTYVFNGNYSLLHAIDKETIIHGIANNLQGNEYRKIFEKIVKDPCPSLIMTEQSKPYYEDVNKRSNMPPFGTCPFPAKDYFIDNYFITDKGIFPPRIPGSERWRIDIMYKLGNDPTPIGGYKLYVIVTKIEE